MPKACDSKAEHLYFVRILLAPFSINGVCCSSSVECIVNMSYKSSKFERFEQLALNEPVEQLTCRPSLKERAHRPLIPTDCTTSMKAPEILMWVRGPTRYSVPGCSFNNV